MAEIGRFFIIKMGFFLDFLFVAGWFTLSSVEITPKNIDTFIDAIQKPTFYIILLLWGCLRVYKAFTDALTSRQNLINAREAKKKLDYLTEKQIIDAYHKEVG